MLTSHMLLAAVLASCTVGLGCGSGRTEIPPSPARQGVVTVSIAPTAATVPFSSSVQFTATVTGTTNTAVRWLLNVENGQQNTGTLSQAGLYTAPAVAGVPTPVTVTAQSYADPTRSADAIVTVIAHSQPPTSSASYYVDCRAGNDNNDGRSSGKAWRTISRVNSAVLHPGDSVLFNRGCIWREQITNSASGNANNPITYGAYGMGAKPSIRGSNTYNSANLWTMEGGNFWYTAGIQSDPGVFAHDGVLGARRASKAAMSGQWDYWYDSTNSRLYVYSTANPAALSALLELAVRDSFVATQWWSNVTYDSLDIRHFRGASAWLGWGVDDVVFKNVDFYQLAKYGLQFNNGSTNGLVSHCSFTDWGVVDGQDYAVHVIGAGPSQTTGPVDVTDSTFVINHSLNNTELSAVLGDNYGWVRNVQRNIAINNGKWPGAAFWTWRPGAAATSILFESNSAFRMGSCGIEIQELNYNGATPKTIIRYNYIEDSDQFDVLDTEALRVRSFSAATPVEVTYNVINRTTVGVNSHPGIYVYGAVGLKIYNNTIYGVDDGILVRSASTGIDIRNNISVFNRRHGISLEAGSTVASFYNNLFFSNTAGNYAGLTPGSGDVTADPKFVNSPPSSSSDFALQSGSPAVNAGTNLGTSESNGLQPSSFWPSNVLTVDQNLYGAWEIGAFVRVGP